MTALTLPLDGRPPSGLLYDHAHFAGRVPKPDSRITATWVSAPDGGTVMRSFLLPLFAVLVLFAAGLARPAPAAAPAGPSAARGGDAVRTLPLSPPILP